MDKESYDSVERYLESLKQEKNQEASLLQENFIKHAHAYASKLNLKLPYLTFKEMGVSEAVLEKAGIKDNSYTGLRSQFILSSKKYADLHDIGFEQLKEAGVPTHVLLQAGYKPEIST